VSSLFFLPMFISLTTSMSQGAAFIFFSLFVRVPVIQVMLNNLYSCVSNYSFFIRRSRVVPGRLQLHYAGRPRASFHVEHLARDPSSQAPLLAYAYKTLRRHDSLRTPLRTGKLSTKADIPPYYAGLLIAMAQAMARSNYVEPRRSPTESASHFVRISLIPCPICLPLFLID
jgi:hypothetical protein